MFGRTSEWVEDANPMHAAPVKARNGNMVLAARVPASEQPKGCAAISGDERAACLRTSDTRDVPTAFPWRPE